MIRLPITCSYTADMLVIGTLLFLLGKGIFATTDCDEFRKGILCPLSQEENILDVVPNIEDEIQCQEECTRVLGCQFFTYEVFSKGSSTCFLFSDCPVNETSSCNETSDC